MKAVRGLRAFGVQLNHHLAAERELFYAGLTGRLVISTPKAAKYGGTVTVFAEPFKKINKIPDSEDPVLKIKEHFKPNPLDGMDFDPRRRV